MTQRARDLFGLTGKVAIVTGGAQGIGAAIARALAHQGASTTMFDIRSEVATATKEAIEDEGHGGEIRVAVCDVTDRDQVQGRVADVLDRSGHIDILVNNAGIHRRTPPANFSEADIDAVFDVNLRGSLFMASAVGKTMVEQRSGSIINLSALGGGIVGLGRGGSVYGMAKGGIVALTRDLAAEWGKFGIRVNAIAPGWVRTPMTSSLQGNAEASAKVMERVPLGRWGEADDVAGVAVFLASDASSYITGTTIPVDGGAANVIAIPE